MKEMIDTAIPASLLWLTLSLTGIVPAAASAQTLDFRAHVGHETADLRYDGGRKVETRETRAGAELWEPLTANIDAGLILGLNWVSQDGDPASEGEEYNGGYGGLRARTNVPLGEGLALQGQVGWLYHRATATANRGDLTLAWHDVDGRVGVSYTHGAVTVAGGGLYRYVDGERRISGKETMDFDTDHGAGAYARLAVGTGGGGSIAVSVVTGPWTGARIEFARRFF